MADEEPQVIIPRYKMIITYDMLPGSSEPYYQFVLGEMIPAMQEMKIYMTEAWHTAYGDYPLRMATFVAEDYATIEDMLTSARWQELEDRMQSFVQNYSHRIVAYRRGFQFIR
jgi:hypothetical protein